MRNHMIGIALKRSKTKAEAAKLLGITEKTLYNYLNEIKNGSITKRSTNDHSWS